MLQESRRDSSQGGKEVKEITILGGGLSGLALAVYLRKRGVPTQLHEARSYPRHKVCGEFICGVQEDVLREMGLDRVVDHSLWHTRMQWYMMGESLLAQEMPQVAWGLSRYDLDQSLAHDFEQLGGQLHLRSRVSQESVPEAGVVSGIGKPKSGKATDWIGLKVHLKKGGEQELEGLEMHLGRAGYLGVCGIESGRVNCCGLFKRDREAKGQGSGLLINYLQRNGLQALAARLEGAEKDEASFSATAGFTLGTQPRQGGLSIGDARHLIPPFTGNGMSMAIESAFLAGQVLERYAKGDLTWSQGCDEYARRSDSFFRKRMRRSAQIHPLLFSSFGRGLLKYSLRARILPVNTLFQQLRTP